MYDGTKPVTGGSLVAADIRENFRALKEDGIVIPASGSGIPVGAIFAFPTETPPSGFLELNGASLLRAGTYADLFAVISTTYGYVDGTHFNLPDFRGIFPRGWAHGQTTDPDRAARTNRGDGTTGDHVGTKQADQYKNHTHTLPTHTGGGYANALQATTDYPGTFASGDSGGNESRPININVLWCIKYLY